VVRLVAKSLKEIAALGLEGCGVGKNGNRKAERSDVTQTFERMFKGSPRFPIRTSSSKYSPARRDDEHVGRKSLQISRHSSVRFV